MHICYNRDMVLQLKIIRMPAAMPTPSSDQLRY